MSTPQDFFNAIPFVTRWQLAGSLGTTILFLTGMASPYYFLLDFNLLFHRFQIWRIISNHLVLGKGFNLLIRLLHVYKYGGELERGTYKNNSVEYSFVLFFCILVETVCGYFLGTKVLSFATVHCIMYLWARNNHTQQVSLMGVLTLKAPYLPWAFVVLTMLLGGDPILDLVGIFAGHVFWFLTDFLPKHNGVTLVKTPTLWYMMWGERPPVTRSNPDAANRNMFGGHSWGGRGYRLHQE